MEISEKVGNKMNEVIVSIILPNLNKRKFLEERINSIKNQIFQDWECIVIDGFSNDGSWELIQNQTRGDHRFLLFQFPPKGIYNAWNLGIKKARGKYIYIATSDDTMREDCLEKLVNLLENYSGCGMAQCGLLITQENGEPSHKMNWDNFPVQRYLGENKNLKHIRYAPFDAVMQSALGIVYSSITQLLIRKSVFDKIGLFEEGFGAAGDWEWEYRASLFYNTVYTPEKLATWRINSSGQATQFDKIDTAKHRHNLYLMQKDAIRRFRYTHYTSFQKKIKKVTFTYRYQAYQLEKRSCLPKQVKFLKLLKYPEMLVSDIYSKVCKRKAFLAEYKSSERHVDMLFEELGFNKRELITKC